MRSSCRLQLMQGRPGLMTWVRQVALRIVPSARVSMAMPPSMTGIRSVLANALRTARGQGRSTQEKIRSWSRARCRPSGSHTERSETSIVGLVAVAAGGGFSVGDVGLGSA